jgi:signal peptidase II
MSKSTFVVTVATLVLAGDQLSKWYVQESIPLYHQIPVVDSFFHLTHVRNTGGAFSLFAGTDDRIRIPFFVGASLVAIGALLYFLTLVATEERLLQFALAGVLGGALGNLIDRVSAGSVTDFLLLHYRGYHWPAFNVADSFISVGVALLLLHSLWNPHKESRGEVRSKG